MPNYCENDLRIFGQSTELKRFMEFAKGKKRHSQQKYEAIDVNKFIPYPKKYAEKDKEAKIHNNMLSRMSKSEIEAKGLELMRDGYNSGGYEWCIANWGTKWGIFDSHLDADNSSDISGNLTENEEGELMYHFTTAWSPPLPVILAMSKKFPDLEFILTYFEGGVGFNGIYVCQGGHETRNEEGKYFGDRGG